MTTKKSNDINPRVDIAFKKIFGVDENKDLLISLINSIVREEDQVKSIIIKNPYNPKNFKIDKLSILDIKAEGHHGKKFNIEMQVTDEKDYDKRALYYWGKLYSEQIGKTSKYGELHKTIGIHFLNFLSIPESPKYHNRFILKEDELGIKYFTDIEINTIELSKFDQESKGDITTLAKKIKNNLDQWVTFLTHHELLLGKDLPKSLQNAYIQKAVEVIGEMNFTLEEREAYDAHINWLRIEAGAIEKAEERGEERGKIEEKIAIARKLLLKNKSIEEIEDITELSKREIEALARIHIK